jgi:hypothetical protein
MDIKLSYNLAGSLKKLQFLDVPDMIANVQVTIPEITDKKAESVTKAQLSEAGTEYLQKAAKEFCSAFEELDKKLAAKIAAAEKSGADVVALATKELATANTVANQIKAATASGAEDAIEKEWALLKKTYAELRTYKIKFAVKIIWTSIKLSVAVARVAASQGADVTGWISIGQNIYKIGMLVYEFAKAADTVQEEVEDLHGELAEKVSDEKAKKQKNAALQVVAQLKNIEPAIKKVEAKLDQYGPKVTAIDVKSKDLAKELEKLLTKIQEEKDNPILKPKIAKLTTAVDATIKQIVKLQGELKNHRIFEAAVAADIAATRKDFTKYTKSALKVVNFLQTAKEVYDNAKDVFDTLKDIVELAT